MVEFDWIRLRSVSAVVAIGCLLANHALFSYSVIDQIEQHNKVSSALKQDGHTKTAEESAALVHFLSNIGGDVFAVLAAQEPIKVDYFRILLNPMTEFNSGVAWSGINYGIYICA